MRSRFVLLSLVLGLVLAFPVSSGTAHPPGGFLTSEPPFITLAPDAPPGSQVVPILTVGETVDGTLFEGIPDGIGVIGAKKFKPRYAARYGTAYRTVDVYVSHEQSTVPFPPLSGVIGPPLTDFVDASVTKWTLRTRGPNKFAVVHGEVAVPTSEGYLRFCSGFLASTKAEGFKNRPMYFANEETNDVVDVPVGAQYGPDPSVAPQRQGGYVVAVDVRTGAYTQVPILGRINHENTVPVPGGSKGYWRKKVALLTTDDTFSATTSQLYLGLFRNAKAILKDKGSLWAFRVTHANGTPVDPTDPFNGANDYLDLEPGDEFRGEFIKVPSDIARGLTADPPQAALEDWSNANNVFQFVRLEDLDYDRRTGRVVYIADTGASRVIPDPTTGRMTRGPSGTVGQADNGRVFKMVFNAYDPRKVDSFTVLAQGDDATMGKFVPFVSPDNMGTSKKSLMLQEDTDNAKIWQYMLGSGAWRVVATVNDPDGESSGIVDASRFFGPGWWLLDVQAHGSFQESEVVPNPLGAEFPDLTIKRENGQLLAMKIPGST